MRNALTLAALIVVIAISALVFSQRQEASTPGRPSPHAINQTP